MEKLNIAELLKDCPKGMELNCTMYENVEFDYVEQNSELPYPIHCLIKINGGYNTLVFTRNGCNDRHPNSKCVIFPKGKTTWEGFQRPFKDGDIVAGENRACSYITIFRKLIDNTSFSHHACLTSFGKFKIDDFADNSNLRIATEEEKQKLFDAIKANGYKWNAETKTLEKLPKFKVGDKIKKKGNNDYRLTTIESINNNYYVIKTPDWFDNCYITDKLYFSNQDNYELVPSKFDITTLKPFDSRVLVRDANCYEWEADIFGRYSDGYITLGGGKWKQCIPYEGNEHLLGTTNDCDKYYKNW